MPIWHAAERITACVTDRLKQRQCVSNKHDCRIRCTKCRQLYEWHRSARRSFGKPRMFQLQYHDDAKIPRRHQRQEYVPKRPIHASENHSFALNVQNHSLPGFVAKNLFVLAFAVKFVRRMGCQPPAGLEPTCSSKTCGDCATAIEMIRIE